MKRLLSFALAVLMLCSLFGCGAGGQAKDDTSSFLLEDEREIISTINSSVQSSKDIITSVNIIIDWQVTTSREDIAAYEASIKEGTEYVVDESAEKLIEQKAEQIKSYLSQVQATRQTIDALEPTGTEQVDSTIAAAKTYFQWLEAALQDIVRIQDFYFAEMEAAKPMTEFNSADYGDDSAMIEAMWNAVGVTVENLGALACPEYMQETFDIYIKKINMLRDILSSLYTGLDLGDVLRLTAGNLLIGRMSIDLANYEMDLTEQFNVQYEKVGERLDGKINTLCSELLANCTALLKA